MNCFFRSLLLASLSTSSTAQEPGFVASHVKLPANDGLSQYDFFGLASAGLGDLDGDGVPDMAVGGSQFFWILFLHPDGTVKNARKHEAPNQDEIPTCCTFDGFGGSLAALGDLDGDGVMDLAVGADGYGLEDEGAVWIHFLESDGSVRETQRIGEGAGGFTGQLWNYAYFGSGVAALGDFDGDGVEDLAVGQPDDWVAGDGVGAVWLLALEPDGTVKASQRIDGASFADESAFGYSVAALDDIDGNGVRDLAVGAAHDGGYMSNGAAWVLFLRADGTVRASQKIDPTHGGFTGVLDPGDGFAWGLLAPGDLDGDGTGDLVVGAAGDDDGGQDRGAIWILFLDADGTVTAHQKVSAAAGNFSGDLNDADYFGSAIGSPGDLDSDGATDLLVGAFGEDQGGAFSGAAWVLFLEPDGTVLAQHEIDADEAGLPPGLLDRYMEFGHAVVNIGDLDGDGLGELAVSAPALHTLTSDSFDATVWVLFLDAVGGLREARSIAEGQGGFVGALDPGDQFGQALAALGDLDGDGVPDLAVGAPGDDDAGDSRGALWVLFLEADGTVKAHQKISHLQGGFVGPLSNQDAFGGALTALGDLDGDGVGDLAVGAVGDDEKAFDAGAVWVLFLSPDGTVLAQQKILSPETFSFVSDYFGSALATLGDFDGDGVRDLAVGSVGDGRGAVWIFFLESDGSFHAHQKISDLEGGFTGALSQFDDFGSSLAALDDLDGDGVGDLAVGAVGDDDGGADRGAVWVLFLASDGTVLGHQKISSTVGDFAGTLTNNDRFGSALGALGDMDADGVADLAVGAPLTEDAGSSDEGVIWLLRLEGVACVDFEHGDDQARTPLVDGQSLASSTAFGRTIELTSSGANLGPVLFDSTPGGPNDGGPDPDLLVDLGNVLILQNTLSPTQTVPGIFDVPDDDPEGGSLRFSFHGPVEPLSIDLVDIGGATGVAHAHLADMGPSVTLVDADGGRRVYRIPAAWTGDLLTHGPPGFRTLDLTTLDPQPGVVGRATAFETPGFDASAVVSIQLRLGGSGAVDNLRWEPR